MVSILVTIFMLDFEVYFGVNLIGPWFLFCLALGYYVYGNVKGAFGHS